MTDKVTDMLIRIKNAYLSKHKMVVLPYFGQGLRLAKVLVEEGFLSKVEVEESKKQKNKTLKMDLVYQNKKPAISEVKIISKPGVRIYLKAKKIKKVLGGAGISIVSTPKGLMTGDQAKKKNLGGEVICEIW